MMWMYSKLSQPVKKVVLCLISGLWTIGMQAQSDTMKVLNAFMVGVGTTNLLDTYLSPEKYRGTELRLMWQSVREPNYSKWSREITIQGDVAFAGNRAGNGTEMAGMCNFCYAWHYNWHFANHKLNLKLGGMADTNVGFIYNNRNGNNPAQARVYINLQPSAVASYQFILHGRPTFVRYEVAVPLVGLMFSPAYGQAYYEIFSEGNYDHNIVPTTTVSTPSLQQMLTLDYKLGRTTIRAGYLGDFQQSYVNNLKTHIYTHALIVGFVKRFSFAKK